MTHGGRNWCPASARYPYMIHPSVSRHSHFSVVYTYTPRSLSHRRCARRMMTVNVQHRRGPRHGSKCSRTPRPRLCLSAPTVGGTGTEYSSRYIGRLASLVYWLGSFTSYFLQFFFLTMREPVLVKCCSSGPEAGALRLTVGGGERQNDTGTEFYGPSSQYFCSSLSPVSMKHIISELRTENENVFDSIRSVSSAPPPAWIKDVPRSRKQDTVV